MSKIVWTNGCFDILHPGHIELFKIGKTLSNGGKLIVGLDYDEKVKVDKGPERPINFSRQEDHTRTAKYIDVVLGFGSRKGT